MHIHWAKGLLCFPYNFSCQGTSTRRCQAPTLRELHILLVLHNAAMCSPHEDATELAQSNTVELPTLLAAQPEAHQTSPSLSGKPSSSHDLPAPVLMHVLPERRGLPHSRTRSLATAHSRQPSSCVLLPHRHDLPRSATSAHSIVHAATPCLASPLWILVPPFPILCGHGKLLLLIGWCNAGRRSCRTSQPPPSVGRRSHNKRGRPAGGRAESLDGGRGEAARVASESEVTRCVGDFCAARCGRERGKAPPKRKRQQTEQGYFGLS